MQDSVNRALCLASCKVSLVSSRLETASFYDLPLTCDDLESLVTVLQDAMQDIEGANMAVPEALRLAPEVSHARQ